MALVFPAKDPQEVLDYTIDWSARIDDNDVIETSTFTLVSGSGLTLGSQSNDDTSTTVWLSAGTLGTTYEILNHIITEDGREMEQTVKIKIKAK